MIISTYLTKTLSFFSYDIINLSNIVDSDKA